MWSQQTELLRDKLQITQYYEIVIKFKQKNKLKEDKETQFKHTQHTRKLRYYCEGFSCFTPMIHLEKNHRCQEYYSQHSYLKMVSIMNKYRHPSRPGCYPFDF